MGTPPDPLSIYHITHVRNLPGIVREGLWSDATCRERGVMTERVGMSKIKHRRLTELPVPCHPGTFVGEYVPFYFCPRSIMLYILHRGNHPEVTYTGGQRPVVHLHVDVRRVVEWAEGRRVRWAYTTRNAATRYGRFHHSLDALHEVDWDAVAATDFRDQAVRDGKQAEFLVHESVPWDLVDGIGVLDPALAETAEALTRDARHRPPVRVKPEWYY